MWHHSTRIAIGCIISLLLFLLLVGGPFRVSSRSGSRDSYEDSNAISALQPLRSHCRVTKMSMLYGEHVYPQLERALVSHRQQSKRWGCGFEVLERGITTRSMFSKQYFLMSIMLRELAKPLEERQEWLMWSDADSIVLNPALSPEIFLPPGDLEDVYALVTDDYNGFNAGVFFLKVHPTALDLLTQTVAYPLAHPDEDLGWFGEQRAMAAVMDSIEANQTAMPYPGIVRMPRPWFNAYQTEAGFEGKPGNMLVHFAGLGETRLSHMADWLEILEQTPGRWEASLDQTFYKGAIPQFWTEFERNHTRS